VETLIHIIMDATGFNRDEIEPDYGSQAGPLHPLQPSPIIMDARKTPIRITIELEDFIHVRTVKDIAQRISEIISRQEGDGHSRPAPALTPSGAD